MIALVTVSYNSLSDITEFMQYVAAQTICDWRLFIIDNSSTDGTAEFLCDLRDPRVTVILQSKNTGVAHGNNVGIQAALDEGAEYVWLINNDTKFDTDLFLKIHRCVKNIKPSVMVHRVMYDEPENMIWYRGGYLSMVKGHTGVHYENGANYQLFSKNLAVNINYAPTCSMIIARDVFAVVGLMDEKYFCYWDDTDFCKRLKNRNINLYYDDDISIVHKIGGSTGGPRSKFTVEITSRNRFYYLAKHFGKLYALLWMIPYIALSVYLCIKRDRSLGNLVHTFKGLYLYFRMQK